MDDMTGTYSHRLKEAEGAFVEAEELLSRATAEWFAQHGGKLSSENHCLRINPVRVSWSPKRTRYERTADLVLKDAVGHPDGKVLKKNVLTFTVEWPNQQEDTRGAIEAEAEKG